MNVYRERPKAPESSKRPESPGRTRLRDDEVAGHSGSTASFALWAARIMVGIIVVVSGMMAAQPWHTGGLDGLHDWMVFESYNIRIVILFGCSLITLAILGRR